MNKELFKKDFGSLKITDLIVGDDMDKPIVLMCGEEKIGIGTHHTQDCCESVYADFSVMKHFVEQLKGKNLERITIKGVEAMGFLLCLSHGYEETKVFIPCYNYQNGYYSSDLELVVDVAGVTTRVDISDMVEDHEG